MDWTTHSVFAQTDHIRYTSRSSVLIICLRKPKMFLETQTDLSLFPGNITLFLFIWIWIRQFQEFKTLQGPESFVMHRGKKKLTFRWPIDFKQALLHLWHMNYLLAALLTRSSSFICGPLGDDCLNVGWAITRSASWSGELVSCKFCSTAVRRESNRCKE